MRTRGIDRSRPDAVLNLLAITFQARDTPSGTATLIFADGGAIQVEVECIEMQMKDLGPVWEAEGRPSHESKRTPRRSAADGAAPRRARAGFARAFDRLLAAKREVSEDVDEAVRAIIDDVAARGDDALIDYTPRFDGLGLTRRACASPMPRSTPPCALCAPGRARGPRLARERIEAYHRAQRPQDR